MTAEPPPFAQRILVSFLRSDLVEEVRGDLEEKFYADLKKKSALQAKLNYWYQVVHYLRPFAIRKSKSFHFINTDMLQSYFKIAVRTMSRQKMFIFVNVFGLSVAVACCIIAYYAFDFNESFDHTHLNANKIYRVNSVRQFQNQPVTYGYVPLALSESIRQNVGDVEKVVRYAPEQADIRIKDNVFDTGLTYVDPDFFTVFSFEFNEGRAANFKDKTKIFISETQAKTFFGSASALGKPVTQILPDGELREFTVGGVFKLQPPNSSFNDDAFALYDNLLDNVQDLEDGTSWKYPVTLFVTVNDRSRVPVIENHLLPFTLANNKIREDFIVKEFKLDPFAGMALRDREQEHQGTWTHDAISSASIIGSIASAVFILLIACFNITNTAVAVASGRLKEIGIRKVMGGLRRQLIAQFLGETIGICLVSLIIGIIFAESFLLPAFNKLWPYLKLTTHYTDQPGFLIFLAFVLLFTGLLAGSYPALYISSFQPTTILKGKLKFGGASLFSRSLLTLQFTISLIDIIFSVAFIGNTRYQRDLDPGFDQKGVMYATLNDGKEFETLRNALAENPQIISIAGSKDHLSSHYYRGPVKYEGRELEVDILDVGDGYLKTVGFHLADGRDFQKDSETDYREAVIITETFASRFGWTNPLGKEILWKDSAKLRVIGVMKDVYTRGLWREMEPMMMRYTPQKNYKHIIISTNPNNLIEVSRFIEKNWKALFPNRVYRPRYMNEVMAEAMLANDNIVKEFIFLGMVAMMLSATGLFSLVSLNILKKTKEIGVRKVFGASAQNIAKIINVEFVFILLIASVLGSYLGSSMSIALMRNIWKYYEPVNAIALALSVIVLFVVCGLTIGFKVYNTTKMNPIDTLRDE